MTDDRDESMLLTVAITLADGLPVDWEGLREAHPAIAEDLDTLRLVEAIRREVSSGGA